LIRIVTCFTAPFFPRAWWQIVIFFGVVVVVVAVVLVVVVVVVVLVVVDVLLLTTCEGSLPATVLALTAPAATSATNRAPVKTFFIATLCLIPTPLSKCFNLAFDRHFAHPNAAGVSLGGYLGDCDENRMDTRASD
jgi:hypothetical protein